METATDVAGWHQDLVDELGRRGWAFTLAATVTAGTLAVAGCANEDTIPVAEAPTASDGSPTPAGGSDRGSGGDDGPGTVAPRAETEPVPNEGDAADDPAIWVDPDDPARSLVIGTDKEGGLAVYDLDGTERQYLDDGEMNNVDLRSDVRFDGASVALVTAGNRTDNTIAVYRLDARSRRLEAVDGRPIEVGFDVYGSCMYRSAEDESLHVIVNSEEGEVEQWQLELDEDDDEVDARMVRTFDVGSQTEGCVADDELGWLYIGEESEGIWRYGADPDTGDERTAVDDTDGNLVADVEGLAIAAGRGESGYLVASSQGDDSFVLYERGGDNRFVRRFRVGPGDGIDDVEETDGIEVTTVALGRTYPSGLFVVQDGENGDENQNFKLVSWDDVVNG